MIILALDSGGASVSAAVTEDDRPIAAFTALSVKKHSVTLLPMVDAVLDCAGKTVSDVDLFAVNVGPGSFTGVRIGVSLVKGLAYGTGKPVAAVSSLAALAENLRPYGGIVCPVMDARRGQFYNALFRDGERITPDRVISADELRRELLAYPDAQIRLAGDGSDLARKLLPDVRFTPTDGLTEQSSAYSSALCALRAGAASYLTAETVQPVYLRMSQAERERKERIENER